MIGEGLVKLIKASVAGNGGYFVQVPEGTVLPAWSYLFASDVPEAVLAGPEGLSRARVQIDCYADTGAAVINLAHSLDTVLNGYHGTLTDGDATRVQECFRINRIDFFDDVSRTYRRMLEYRIWYAAQ
jgi:hypothetical protein